MQHKVPAASSSNTETEHTLHDAERRTEVLPLNLERFPAQHGQSVQRIQQNEPEAPD
jgi:hypothetical protein